MGQISVASTGAAYAKTIPGLSRIPVIGPVLFSYGFMTYLCIILACVLAFFLSKTRKGLNLRAVGESGDRGRGGNQCYFYKYLATCIGCGISGLGGLYFVMEYSGGTWTNNGFGDRGWLAVALVIFSLWKPLNAIWGSILFGGLYILYLYIPGVGKKYPGDLQDAAVPCNNHRSDSHKLQKEESNQPPAGLGLPYFREER